MPVYQLTENEISFPHPTLARRDGLLAVGGDLSGRGYFVVVPEGTLCHLSR